MADDEDTSGTTEPVVEPTGDPDPTSETTTDITPDSTPDVSVYIAKISELEGVIAGKDSEIEALNTALTVSKAANYDLLVQIPTEDEIDPLIDPVTDDSVSGGIDTLFGKKEN